MGLATFVAVALPLGLLAQEAPTVSEPVLPAEAPVVPSGPPVLVEGDTHVLIGLAGDIACVAADDPMDCEAMRPESLPDNVLLRLAPILVTVLPVLGGEAPSLLLPAYPYGLDEPVNPSLELGLSRHPDPLDTVRIRIDSASVPRTGTVRAVLVGVPGEAHLWEDGPAPAVLLDFDLKSADLDRQGEGTHSLTWEGTSPPPTTALVAPDPETIGRLASRMGLAAATCARDARGRSHPHHRRSRKLQPFRGDALLAVVFDANGRATAAATLGPAWSDPDLDRCLEVNARALDLAPPPSGGTIALVRVPLDSEAGALPPAQAKNR